MKNIDQSEFTQCDDCWMLTPSALNGSTLKIESVKMTPALRERASIICNNWEELLSLSKRYIESQRGEYKLSAKKFVNPNAFIESGDKWAIYFDTESESECVVGVEFNNNEPFELTIGDWSE